MIKIDEFKNKLKELGYYAEDELIYEAYNALYIFNSSDINSGQDIYAICLEGPPGAGKTEFAKTYTKLANEIFDDEVAMIDYQCDATTGKTELFEDINISAAIRKDADNVNIPGKLVEAINNVNDGKKIVLFIDEYDKAREETDAFLLQFLQSGKINSTQHGDLQIKDEYKSNLQVILCKNDMREELSGPLSRRTRIIRLDYMKPDIFYQVANRVLIDEKQDKVNDGLLNLVALIYENAYSYRDLYNRLPSCSEMLIAIEDADRLMKNANAPKHIIYNTITKNMFKSLDDLKTFGENLKKSTLENDKKLKKLVEEMKSKETETKSLDLNDLISQKIFAKQEKDLSGKTAEMQELILEYQNKFAQMEERRKKAIEEELEKILLENGKLVSTTNIPDVIKNFEDESAFVKRGYNIFDLSYNDWTDIGNFSIPHLSHHSFIEELIQFADTFGIKIYENGILVREDGEQKLIAVTELDEANQAKYRIMSNWPVLPSKYLIYISNLIDFAFDVANKQPQTAQQIANATIGIVQGNYTLDSLIYSDSETDLEQVEEHIYHMNLQGIIEEVVENDSLTNLIDIITSNGSDIEKALTASKKIMQGKQKVLVNE